MMRAACCFLLAVVAAAPGQDAKPAPKPNHCLTCHAETELWEEADRRFFVRARDLATDVHWKAGLLCHDCHGGDPTSDEYVVAHSKDLGFSGTPKPAEVPSFCGRCHADADYMRKYVSSPQTNHVAEFLASGHGKALVERGDPNAPSCTTCHGRHDIRAVDDLESPVYPTRVAGTCNTCHGDADKMAPYRYHGRPIGAGQLELWRDSVHGRAMLEKGDISAPTCNDCHGNHGSISPEIGSVANVCGSCHGRIAELFQGTRMKHAFEKGGLPGCATCHGHHAVTHPTDEMLGTQAGDGCAECHQNGRHGATLAGQKLATTLRRDIDGLAFAIRNAEEEVAFAERLGMPVEKARFGLSSARDALHNARVLVHTFAQAPVAEAVSQGRASTDRVVALAQDAVDEHAARRVWLALSLLLILGAVVVLLIYIKHIGMPDEE